MISGVKSSSSPTCSIAPHERPGGLSSPTVPAHRKPISLQQNHNYRAIPIQGSPASGVSSGAALTAMAATSDKSLPAGYSHEWTGTAYQEYQANGQTGVILSLAILFAYLFLVSLYESWIIPAWRRPSQPARRGHADLRRHARGESRRPLRHSDALCDLRMCLGMDRSPAQHRPGREI
jgi:AcrB/AcrD/AcrF family